MSAVVWKS